MIAGFEGHDTKSIDDVKNLAEIRRLLTFSDKICQRRYVNCIQIWSGFVFFECQDNLQSFSCG